MQVWKSINFRLFIITNSLETLAAGIGNVAKDLLIKEKFGTGDELIGSNIFLALPRIVFAPWVGQIILKKPPKIIASIAMVSLAGIYLLQTKINDYKIFTLTIILRAIIGIACIGSLRTLQIWTIPKGKNIEANGVYLASGRTLFFLAPFLLKIGHGYLTIVQYYYITGIILLLAAIISLRISLKTVSTDKTEQKGERLKSSYVSLFRLCQKKPILLHLYMPAFGYFTLMGSLNLFLLWKTSQALHLSDASYKSLLTMQGVGSAIAMLLAPWIIKKLKGKITMKNFYFSMRVFYILVLVNIAWLSNFYGMATLLLLSALPQALASVCFYTVLQKHLTKQEQSMVHTLAVPIWQACSIVSGLLGMTYTHAYLSLQNFWLLTGMLALNICVLPWLIYRKNNYLPRLHPS